jgi:hypothetical protein
MKRRSARNEPICEPGHELAYRPGDKSRQRYSARTPEYYLQMLEPSILDSFSPSQQQAIEALLTASIPKPAPKLVDLRFGVDLLFSQFYVVLFVGKDRRRQQRQYLPEQMARWGNAIAAVLLLISLNLGITLILFMFAYLVKSAVGIDLTPGHLVDQLDRF